jgi:hypothetical protein
MFIDAIDERKAGRHVTQKHAITILYLSCKPNGKHTTTSANNTKIFGNGHPPRVTLIHLVKFQKILSRHDPTVKDLEQFFGLIVDKLKRIDHTKIP